MMPVRFRAAVNRIVFWRGNHFEVYRVIALQTFNKRHAHASGEIGVFAVSFLTTAPARITEDVDIGAPKGQAFILTEVIMPERFMVFCSCLGRNDVGEFEH